MDLDEYLNYESFLRTFAKGPHDVNIQLLRNAGQSIEKLDTKALRAIVHKYYDKWPHTENKKFLINGVKRGLQLRFYKELYGHDPRINIIEDNNNHMRMMDLRNEEFYYKTTGPVLSLDRLIEMAQQVGISQACIDKICKLKPGMAKMQLTNVIKNTGWNDDRLRHQADKLLHEEVK